MANLWSAANGFMATPTLSEELRQDLQPKTAFLQFCDVEAAVGKNRGEKYSWNTYGDLAIAGSATGIAENLPMPETDFPVTQAEVTITEFGMAVPYSGKFDDLSEHNVRTIVDKSLKNHAAKTLDSAAEAQFDNTLLRFTSTSATAGTLTDTGTASGNHTNEMTLKHVKEISYTLQERNIPVYDGQKYMCVSRPRTLSGIKDELEAIHQHTPEGWGHIMNGEIGYYDDIRFVNQTSVANSGWAVSDAAYFFGADTVTEAIACPLEVRGKIPDDYGRGKGLAWYFLGNYGITHADATNAATKAQSRIIKWDSVA